MPFFKDPNTNIEHKFACSHCIKGHRSTNCAHNDRPLFHIRKKGRPVSQCPQCRALRKNRSLHTRCECPSRVQHRGSGNNSDIIADLPEGMMKPNDVKDFIERLNSEQGGCRNCNSSRCQCESRTTQSIAPASPSPGTSISLGSPSPYTVGYSPFPSMVQPQMRSPMYPGTPQYSPTPQFTGMPPFPSTGYFQPPTNQPLTSNTSPNVIAQVHEFRRRQEQLMATSERQIHEAAMYRKRSHGHENLVEPLQQNPTSQFPEPYSHQRASFSVPLGSSVEANNLSTAGQHLSLPQQTFSNPHDSSHEQTSYGFLNDSSPSLDHAAYSAYLQNSIYRHPPPVVMQSRTPSISHPVTNIAPTDPHSGTSSYIAETGTQPQEPPESSNLTLSPKQHQSAAVAVQEAPQSDAVVVFEPQQDASVTEEGNPPENEEEAEPIGIQSLDRAWDWEDTDNDWLFRLDTECAKPGAVCECGPSCCCPGCFTHTNNAADQLMLKTVQNKFGGMLDSEKDEVESGDNTPRVLGPSQPSTSNADAKL